MLFILSLIWLVLMALFCAAIRRDFVSLFLATSRFLVCDIVYSSFKTPIELYIIIFMYRYMYALIMRNVEGIRDKEPEKSIRMLAR